MFLPGESQGRGSLVGCRLWGCRVGHDWSDLAAAAAAGAQSFNLRTHLSPQNKPYLQQRSLSIPSPLSSWKPLIYFLFISTCMCMLSCFSHVWLFATIWTVACQAPLSMGFSRQEYWNRLPCHLSGIFLTQGLIPHFMSPKSAEGFFITSVTWEALLLFIRLANSGYSILMKSYDI